MERFEFYMLIDYLCFGLYLFKQIVPLIIQQDLRDDLNDSIMMQSAQYLGPRNY